MAEALLRHHFGSRYESYSAGTDATHVDPRAISALEKMDVGVSGLRSKSVDEFKGAKFDEVVTVCDTAKETCPFFPGASKYTHRSFQDPPELISEGVPPSKAFDLVLEEIDRWILAHFSR